MTDYAHAADEIAESAAEAVREEQRRQEDVQTIEDAPAAHAGNPPIDNLNELYGRLFFGHKPSQYIEVDNHLSSGRLEQEEINWMHGLQDTMRFVSVMQQQYGLPMTPTIHDLQRKMEFIPRVSMSHKGFATMEVSQNRMQADEFHQIEEGDDEPGTLSKLWNNLQGTGLAGDQVIGSPEYGDYTGTARRRRMW